MVVAELDTAGAGVDLLDAPGDYAAPLHALRTHRSPTAGACVTAPRTSSATLSRALREFAYRGPAGLRAVEWWRV